MWCAFGSILAQTDGPPEGILNGAGTVGRFKSPKPSLLAITQPIFVLSPQEFDAYV